MGSIDKACISGFLCRLCSEMHRTVIHIYGDQGQKHGLVEKINGYLPITISPTDPLPKTICETCLGRVEQHYQILLRLSQYRQKNFSGIKKASLISSRWPPQRSSIATTTEDEDDEEESFDDDELDSHSPNFVADSELQSENTSVLTANNGRTE